MILQAIPQVPAPPLPPEIPQVIVASGPPEWVPFIVVIVLSLTAILVWPLIRAAARRIEGGGGDAALRSEIDQLHERLADVEQLQQKVFDLETRLEFSERLLTQQREALLQRPEGGA